VATRAPSAIPVSHRRAAVHEQVWIEHAEDHGDVRHAEEQADERGVQPDVLVLHPAAGEQADLEQGDSEQRQG